MVAWLQKALSGLTALAAFAYSLGWLKTSSYFQSFGIGLSSLDLTIQEYLFESWYVVENVVFFVLLSWVLNAGFRLKLPSKVLRWGWWILLAMLSLFYLMLPFGTNWAFGHLDWKLLAWIVSHYYSVLKFIPFAVYMLLVVVVGSLVLFLDWKWDTLEDIFRVQTRRHLFFLYLVVLMGWSFSLAKHVGAIDANNVLRSPAKYLSRVGLHISSTSPELKPLEANQNLYSLYESPKRYFLWDTTDFVFARRQKALILVVPREKVEWIHASKELQIEPGALFF